MTDFKGAHSGIQAIRLVFMHISAVLKLVGTWTAIGFLFSVIVVLLWQPAGAGMPFLDQMNALAKRGFQSSIVVHALPDLFGSLSISITWIRFVVLGEEPRNPVRLNAIAGSYFGQSFAIGFISLLALLPGGILAGVGAAVASGTLQIVLLVAGALVAAIAGLVVYARLRISLAAIAVENDAIGVAQAWDLTRAHTPGLVVGYLVAYLLPAIALIILAGVAGAVGAVLMKGLSGVVVELISSFTTFSLTIVLAGYNAIAYKAFVPGDHGDQIARHFE